LREWRFVPARQKITIFLRRAMARVPAITPSRLASVRRSTHRFGLDNGAWNEAPWVAQRLARLHREDAYRSEGRGLPKAMTIRAF
jgi:hypothetical protein